MPIILLDVYIFFEPIYTISFFFYFFGNRSLLTDEEQNLHNIK